MQLPPAVEVEAAEEYTATMRGAVAVVELLRAGGDGMSTAELAAALGLSRSGAWRLMDRLCAAHEFGVYFDSPAGSRRGKWYLMLDGKLGLRADGFEGRPLLK